jgi:hypothetical protein
MATTAALSFEQCSRAYADLPACHEGWDGANCTALLPAACIVLARHKTKEMIAVQEQSQRQLACQQRCQVGLTCASLSSSSTVARLAVSMSLPQQRRGSMLLSVVAMRRVAARQVPHWLWPQGILN